MIQDLFLRRYPQQIYWADRPTAEIHNLFAQAAHIIFGDLVEPLQLDVDLFKRAHDALALETGRGRLYDAPSWDAVCGEFLTETYDLWKDCQRRRKSRPRRRCKTRPVVEAVRHGARASHIAGACHGALARQGQ